MVEAGLLTGMLSGWTVSFGKDSVSVLLSKKYLLS